MIVPAAEARDHERQLVVVARDGGGGRGQGALLQVVVRAAADDARSGHARPSAARIDELALAASPPLACEIRGLHRCKRRRPRCPSRRGRRQVAGSSTVRHGCADARPANGRRLHSRSMTIELARRPVHRSAATATRPRIFSGIQPSGVAHIGNDLGAIRNYVTLQAEYEAIYCIVDYHALTSLHDARRAAARRRARWRPRCWRSAWIRNAARCSSRATAPSTRSSPGCWHGDPGQLAGADADVQGEEQTSPTTSTTGCSTYPVLQAADIVIYKASLVPVGRDQAAHLELSREIVRALQRAATARRSPSRRPSTPRRRSCSARTASAR